jgi:hypothetical protein
LAEERRILEEFKQSTDEPLDIRVNTVQGMLAQAHLTANLGVKDVLDEMEAKGAEEETCNIDESEEYFQLAANLVFYWLFW